MLWKIWPAMTTTIVELVPPNDEWPARALAAGQHFAQALGDNLVAMHHIGSTSIPGIHAKPIIDLLPEVRSLELLDQARTQIEALGYEFWGEYGLPGRRFCPRSENGKRTTNVHCYQTGAPELGRHLAFRDYLRAHPEKALAYEAEKMRCAALHPDDAYAYTDCKSDWIRAAERAAVEWAQARATPQT